jgi:preprotein translocase subunit YajC
MEYLKYVLCIIAILVIFYFSLMPARKQNKKLKEMQDKLKIGDKIITYSGFSGIIVEVLEDRVIVELNPEKNKVSIEKWAVAGIDERDIY